MFELRHQVIYLKDQSCFNGNVIAEMETSRLWICLVRRILSGMHYGEYQQFTASSLDTIITSLEDRQIVQIV